MGTDVVPVPRPYAPTLGDKTYVYQPNAVAGNKPVTIGHAYSLTSCLPEKATADPPWVIPLVLRRVTSTEKATVVGAAQLQALLTDEQQPFHQDLCVHVADSAYSAAEFLGRVGPLTNLISVTRTPENRVFYRQFGAATEAAPAGHPRWYGERFALKDAATWGPPDETATTQILTRHGHAYTVELQGWHNLLMRGKRGLPMHQHPFTLIRAVIRDEHGQPVFKRALWLIVLGEQRASLSLVDAWAAYRQRYDLEHYFRFGKQRLLLAAYQTPVVEHEENWLYLVQLATVQLWLARELVEAQLYPWERYLPPRATDAAAPSQVQRDWARIIRQVGTPAQAPKRRGKSSGRAKGTRVGRRPRQRVVKKTARTRRKAA
ncbi:MAG: transposase [Chloroflexi bacterium]|nr:transposase [Chloroflexota bacterium]